MGAELLKLRELSGKQPALMSIVDAAIYEIRIPFGGNLDSVESALGRFDRAAEVK